MTDSVLDFKTKRSSIIVTVQEFLLSLFIVLSPIYKAFTSVRILGLNPITIVIGLVLLCYAVNVPSIVISRQKSFFSLIILVAFCMELFWADGEIYFGWVLTVLLYVFFLQTDVAVSIRKIYRAFLISSIVAAIFTIVFGLRDGAMMRVATLIDGSIAPIAITVALFCNPESKKQGFISWNTLKAISVISSIVVLAFGMSRARFLVVAVCFGMYGFSKLIGIVKNGGKTTVWSAMIFFIAIIFILFLLVSGILQDLFKPLLDRFLYEGLDSMGRDVEIEFGLQLFKGNMLWGGGWNIFHLQDLNGSIVAYNNHCAYVAILARGGLFFAIPTFLSYYMLLRKSFKFRHTSKVALVMMIVFLLLSYGNAGMFNYTICSLIPLVVLNIKKELYYENK